MAFVYEGVHVDGKTRTEGGARLPNGKLFASRAYDAEKKMELLCIHAGDVGRNGHRGGGGRYAFLHPGGKILMQYYDDTTYADDGHALIDYELFHVFCDPPVEEEVFKPLIIEAVEAFLRARYSEQAEVKRIYFRGALHPWTEDGELRNLCKGLLNGVTEDFREYMGYDV